MSTDDTTKSSTLLPLSKPWLTDWNNVPPLQMQIQASQIVENEIRLRSGDPDLWDTRDTERYNELIKLMQEEVRSAKQKGV